MQQPNRSSNLSLSEALHCYWPNLIGVAVFPAVASVGMKIFHVPFPVFLAFFVLVWGPAVLANLNGRAPNMLLTIMWGIWMGGVMLAFILLQIIKAFVA